MVIHSFFDKEVMVRRLSNNSFVTATVSVDCHRQNLSQKEAQLIDGTTGKDYKIWADPNANILEGDRIKVQDKSTKKVTQELEVLSIEKKDYGINQHIEVIATELDA